MFLTIIGCIETALADPPEQISQEVQENAKFFAFLILRSVDGDFEDGKAQFRIGRPDGIHTTPLMDSSDEDTRYSLWLKQFSIDASPYHDDFIRILRSIATTTTDTLGRKFWRIRRLEELELQGR